MEEKHLRRIKKLGWSEKDFEPKKDKIVSISREEFNLLDATDSNTTYYIAESNGTVSILKGDNK